MPWVFALIGVVLVAAVGLVLAGKLPPVPQPTHEPRTARLPENPSAADVDQLRLPVVFRGYRMEEVDSALAVLRNRIAALEASAPAPPTWTGVTDAEPEDPATDR
jgi:DivIVA domain-containing protein